MMQYPERFDVIVVGGDHAGTEAALAAARLGVSTLVFTQNIETRQMSCNRAIGGIGKGDLVKALGALGGLMVRAADRAAILFRGLNATMGAAARATSGQMGRPVSTSCKTAFSAA